MNTRHLTAVTALASALVLTACGSGDDPALTGSPGSGSGASSAPAAAQANDADIAFLTGMIPHHEQAVEMSEMVLDADPPAEVARIAQQIKAAQDPEIQQMNTMLDDLGKPAGSDGGHGGHGGGSAGGHGGMMSEAEMEALDSAQGAEAARLYLEGMIKHHEGAIAASKTQLADGKYEPARKLATTIAEQQATEITEMKRLLAAL